jgi:hypothetical protein
VCSQLLILKSCRVWVNKKPSGNKPATHCWDKVVSTRRQSAVPGHVPTEAASLDEPNGCEMGDVINSGIRRKTDFWKAWPKFELLLTALASLERQNPDFNRKVTLKEIATALHVLQNKNPERFGSLSMTETIIDGQKSIHKLAITIDAIVNVLQDKHEELLSARQEWKIEENSDL